VTGSGSTCSTCRYRPRRRPLTTREQGELRSLSSRADITATSFVNTYEWGDFKGDPRRLMERYFDAHRSSWRSTAGNRPSDSPASSATNRL
jgi:hypothetical protein